MQKQISPLPHKLRHDRTSRCVFQAVLSSRRIIVVRGRKVQPAKKPFTTENHLFRPPFVSSLHSSYVSIPFRKKKNSIFHSEWTEKHANCFHTPRQTLLGHTGFADGLWNLLEFDIGNTMLVYSVRYHVLQSSQFNSRAQPPLYFRTHDKTLWDSMCMFSSAVDFMARNCRIYQTSFVFHWKYNFPCDIPRKRRRYSFGNNTATFRSGKLIVQPTTAVR